MRGSQAKEIWAILFKPANQFVMFGSKCAWAKTGYAKNAFAMHMGHRFDEAPDYEVVNLAETYYILEGLDK